MDTSALRHRSIHGLLARHTRHRPPPASSPASEESLPSEEPEPTDEMLSKSLAHAAGYHLAPGPAATVAAPPSATARAAPDTFLRCGAAPAPEISLLSPERS